MSSIFPRRRLPHYICPRKFVNLGVEISASLAISELNRLCSLLASSDGEALVKLAFSKACHHDGQLIGSAAADMSLVCQRCLAIFSLPIECRFELMMVSAEQQAVNLPGSWQPLVIKEEQLDLYELIENEFLLALPSVAYHQQGCINPDLFLYGGSLANNLAGKRVQGDKLTMNNRSNNPFEALKFLKNSSK